MNLNLKDKVVLIAGGAGEKGSISETILQSLSLEGAIPAVIDIADRGRLYIDQLHAENRSGLFVKTDVTDPTAVESAIKEIVAKYNRIDVVINIVGVNDSVGLNASLEEFMDSIKLNLATYFLTVKYALPHLKQSRGNILNIGSKVAQTGQGGTSGYAAAKGGVLALTREWAVDLIDYGIRSNAVIIAECWTPSYDAWIQTLDNSQGKLNSILSKIPLEKRMTTPEEIADTVLFLISDRSSHTNGQHVFVDGGYTHLDRALLSNQ